MKKTRYNYSTVNLYPFVKKIAGNLHGHQKKTFSLIVAAIVLCGAANTFSIAQCIAGWTKVLFDSAKKRIYRFIGNPRLDNISIYQGLVETILPSVKGRPIISIDWTEWHSNLRLLTATLSVARRSVIIFAQAFVKNRFIRSQNSIENAFIQSLVSFSPSGQESCPRI